MRVFILCLLTGLHFVCATHAQLPYVPTVYNTSNGLPHSTVNNIMQDKYGSVWLATSNGFSRFDGIRFQTYRIEDNDSIEYADNQIRQVKEDSEGYIWLLNMQKHVFRFNPVTHTSTTLPGRLKQVNYLHVSHRAGVWLHLSDNTLVHAWYDEHKQLQHRQVYAWPADESVVMRSISDDPQQRVWILTERELLEYSLVTQRIVRHDFDDRAVFRCMRKHRDSYMIGSNHGRLYVYHKETGQYDIHRLPTREAICRIKAFQESTYLLNTEHDGFFLYDIVSKEMKHLADTATADCRLPSSHINNYYVDKDDNIWVTYTGLPYVTFINAQTFETRQYHMKDRNNRPIDACKKLAILEDSYGRLWFYSNNRALNYFDASRQELVPLILPGTQNMPDFTEPSLCYLDRQRNIWLGKKDKGLLKITLKNDYFNLQSPVPEDLFDTGNQLEATCLDADGRLWAGTQDSCLCIYDRNSRRFVGYLSRRGTITPQKQEIGHVSALHCDPQGRIWIGLDGRGVLLATPAGSERYALSPLRHDEHDAYSLSGNRVTAFAHDGTHLWIGTYRQGLNLVTADERGDIRFIHAGNRLTGYPLNEHPGIKQLCPDSLGHLWIATNKGVLQASTVFDRPEAMTFRLFEARTQHNETLPHNLVYHIYASRSGDIWFSTFGKGLFRLPSGDTHRLKHYTTDDRLPSNVLYTMHEDASGHLWIASERGLCRFNPANETPDTYDHRFFPSEITFNQMSTACHVGERLFFTTDRGILSFVPSQIKKDPFKPYLIFTAFTADNETLTDARGYPLDLTSGRHLTLTHEQNSFNIRFVALDMNYPASIKYAYRLDGFDEWNYTGNDPRAVYTNIPPGEYTFRVRSTNSDGVWTDNERVLYIKVLPTFWESGTGALTMVTIVLAVIGLATAILLRLYTLKNRVRVERELAEVKTTFFTNIVHEMRTPFTLIIAPLENILAQKDLSRFVRQNLELIQSNTTRTLKLINQILDFQKLKSNKMQLHVRHIELRSFFTRLLDSFDTLAESHHMRLTLQMQPETLHLWADEDKLESIFFNLLSNAFKYTPDNKAITVHVSEDKARHIIIAVSDEGVGIPKDKQALLFNRFETFLSKHSLQVPSTGIGLSLVKELVNLHRGDITFESRLNEGTTFTIHLLKGREHFAPDTEFILEDMPRQNTEAQPARINESTGSDKADTSHPNAEIAACTAGHTATSLTDDAAAPADNETQAHTAETNDTTHTDAPERNNRPLPLILIVEDNAELRDFLSHTFAGHYRILTAANGEEGFNQAMRHDPDLIVSDINMPVCSGLEMTRRLRQQTDTNHIPIILLTSRSSIESQVESLQLGVEDYVMKPFSSRVLEARIDNILHKRRLLQNYYRSRLMPAPEEAQETQEKPETQLSPANQALIDRLTAYIRDNLSSTELNVERISSEMNISRTALFKKLKAIAGISLTEMIRNLRMQAALTLLKDDTISLAEIADRIGYYDSHHFSKSFKKEYGLSPTEYRKQHFTSETLSPERPEHP